MRAKTVGMVLVILALVATAAPARASHIWVTDPSINGVPLDGLFGFTNPTIDAAIGDSLDVAVGIFDFCGGTCAEDWTMHFEQTGGSLTLTDPPTQWVVPGDGLSFPNYVVFSTLLTSAGTWTGFLQPLQNESCPSYLYGDGHFAFGGCVDGDVAPSESIPFSLNVAASAVPEPGTWLLLGTGLLAGVAYRRRGESSSTSTTRAQ